MIQEDDSVIISQVLSGNTPAFAKLVDRYKDMVYSVTCRIISDHPEAEEIAQDIFLKAYQALTGFKQESKFSTWLYRIAVNMSLSAVRKRKMVMASLSSMDVEHLQEGEIQENMYAYTDDEQVSMVNEAIKNLHPQDAMLVGMFYTDELSIQDISDITGLSQANVKVRLHRLRKKLYSLISEMMKMHELKMIRK